MISGLPDGDFGTEVTGKMPVPLCMQGFLEYGLVSWEVGGGSGGGTRGRG
jgi:hypothetical protein